MRSFATLAVGCVLSSAVMAAPQFGSDSCSTPDVVPLGEGITFYNGFATTGPEGQGWTMCDFSSTTAIENDVWFLWTAPATGKAEFSTCTSNPDLVQTRFAVYPGAGCPGSIPIECTQYAGCDSNFGGWVSFEVEEGSVWLIQVGSVPGTQTGFGSMALHVYDSTDHVYRYDSASPLHGHGLGSNNAGEFLWMNRFDAQGGSDVLVQIEVAFGSPYDAAAPILNGTPATVAVWSDPNQDGNPNDAVLLASVPTTVQNAETGIPLTVFLPEPVPVQGKFFVGARMAVQAGQKPGVAVNEVWGNGYAFSERAWVAASPGPIDLACLSCLNPPPAHLWGQLNNVVLRAVGGADSNTFCFGDGSGAACPCGNTGASNEGCANASGAGALLWSTGSAKVATNNLALRATHLPPSGGIGLAVAGSQQQAGGAGIPFQDGLLCVGGQIYRFPAQAFTDSLVQESVVSASNGVISAGSTWNFQVWYRDVVGACGGSTGNLTNALAVTFAP